MSSTALPGRATIAFFGRGRWAVLGVQGLELPRQAVYHLSPASSPCYFIFLDSEPRHIESVVITDMHHHTQVTTAFKYFGLQF
jgi:hypothetical protein